METTARKVKWSELVEGARRHYRDLSDMACSWMSTVPHALDFYEKHGDPDTTRRITIAAPEMLAALKEFVSGEEARFIPGYHSAIDAIRKAEKGEG